MDLGDRMKEYERVYKTALMKKTPAIIRLDGKAFHTWTRGLDRPFDKRFYAAMAQTASLLVNEIQGAVFAFGQSDEISILLKDYATFDTDAWFGGAVNKINSVSASMATGYFNRYAQHLGISDGEKLAFFDARVFTLPPHEVVNYFIWRQQDCTRNSIQSTGQEHLGHKTCEGLKNQEVIEALLKLDPPVDWNRDLPPIFRYGYGYGRGDEEVTVNLPVFSECRDFIEIHLQNDL